MNMNFIAFSSRVKLLDRPQLDAAAAGHRHLRGHLDGLLQIPGLDQQQAGQLAVAHPDRGCSLDWLSSTQASASFLDIAFMSFSTRYTRQMDFKTLPLRANGCGHQLVVQRGPKSTAAMATRGSRRGVRARAQRCADKDRSPARP